MEGGGSVVLISHLLGEILSTADRIVVMRDGKVVAEREASTFSRDTLVESMGSVVHARDTDVRGSKRETGAAVVDATTGKPGDAVKLSAHRGEIVGLAGLGGHGQTDMLIRIFEAAGRSVHGVTVAGPVAMVAGDRQSDGVFPLWSIQENMTIASLAPHGEALADRSRRRTRHGRRLEAAHCHPYARASTTRSCRSRAATSRRCCLPARSARAAEIILMDDPMRGVDIGTKQEVYGMLRAEAASGRTFLWYTTEMDELHHCDHVYVFRDGRIVTDLSNTELTEAKVLQSSFGAAA